MASIYILIILIFVLCVFLCCHFGLCFSSVKFSLCYAFNLPVSWTYFIVYFVVFGSPSSLSILILPIPISLCSSFLNSFLWLLYLLHSIRKCSTVSFPYPHSQYGVFLRLKRC